MIGKTRLYQNTGSPLIQGMSGRRRGRGRVLLLLVIVVIVVAVLVYLNYLR